MVGQKVLAETVVTLDEADTVNGGKVGIKVEDGNVILTDAAGNDVNVTATDLEAMNGVVHVIDAVLLPPELVPAEEPKPDTVVDIASGSDDFSLLVDAVTKAGLADTLSDPEAELTVFAPTNAAFEAALESLGTTLEEVDVETLTAILTYHVVGSKALAADVVGLDMVSTLNGGDVKIRVEDKNVILTDVLGNDVNVTATDLEAMNGVVHVIDAVLLPPELLPDSVVDIAVDNDFSSLVAAVMKAGLGDALSDPEAELTVFAPTNEAFAAALMALGTTLDDVPVELLTQILTYHVVGKQSACR